MASSSSGGRGSWSSWQQQGMSASTQQQGQSGAGSISEEDTAAAAASQPKMLCLVFNIQTQFLPHPSDATRYYECVAGVQFAERRSVNFYFQREKILHAIILF